MSNGSRRWGIAWGAVLAVGAWGCGVAGSAGGGSAQTREAAQALTTSPAGQAPSTVHWQKTSSESGWDGYNAMTVDDGGNILLSHQRSPSAADPYETLEKWDPTGNTLVWSIPLGPSYDWHVVALRSAGSGRVVLRRDCMTMPECNDPFGESKLTLYNSDGSVGWRSGFGPPISAFGTNSHGETVVATPQASFGSHQVAGTLQKIDASGNSQWFKQLPWEDSGRIAISAAAAGPNGETDLGLRVTGTYTFEGHTFEGGQEGRTFLVQLDGGGTITWVRAFEGAPVLFAGLEASAAGTVVALVTPGQGDPTSAFNGQTLMPLQAALVVLAADGTPRFVRETDARSEQPTLMALDPSGEVTVANKDGSKLFLTEFDLAGDLVWKHVDELFGADPSTFQLGLIGLTVGPDHQVFAAGSYNGGGLNDVYSNGRDGYLLAVNNGAPPVAFDTFSRSSGLGANWTVANGQWSTDGASAHAGGYGNYAVWNAMPDTDSAVSVRVSPASKTYEGVIARADPQEPDRNHYAAYVGPDGRVALARRNDWGYTTLATGASCCGLGSYRLTLAVTGTDPVELSVSLDGEELIHTTDSSTQRLTSGKEGIFDYDGSGDAFDDFWIQSLSENSVFPPPPAGTLVAVARFDGSDGQGAAPDTEDFDGTASYSTDPDVWVSSCHWDFGDGTGSNDCWAEHVYDSAGTYHPTLTVTGSDGSTSSASLTVTVSDGALTGGSSGSSSGSGTVVAVVHFDGSDGSGAAPDEEDLDGTGSYSNDPDVWIQACHWDFGDGATSGDCWVAHTYTAAGIYHPTLTVTGSDGSTSSASVTVTVSGG